MNGIAIVLLGIGILLALASINGPETRVRKILYWLAVVLVLVAIALTSFNPKLLR